MRTIYITYLALVIANFLGVVREAAFPPMVSLIYPSWIASALLVIVYFYNVYSNTLDICLSWIFSHCPMWIVSRDPILRSSANIFCTSELLVIYCLNSSEILLLSVHLVTLSRALFVPIFPILLGDLQIFRKESLEIEVMSQEVLFVPLGFSLVIKKVSFDGFLTVTTGLLRWPSFLVL